MGFRFRKSVKIIPGVRLNFSKSGVSTSIGGRGCTVNFGHGRVRTTLGIPGTGISYSTSTSTKPKSKYTSLAQIDFEHNAEMIAITKDFIEDARVEIQSQLQYLKDIRKDLDKGIITQQEYDDDRAFIENFMAEQKAIVDRHVEEIRVWEAANQSMIDAYKRKDKVKQWIIFAVVIGVVVCYASL